MNSDVIRRLLIVAVALGLGACESMPQVDDLVKDRRTDYKQSSSLPPLEVPPDLTSTTIDDAMVVPDITPSPTATYSDYAGERSGGLATVRSEAVLPDQAGMYVERDGDKRWLVLRGEPEQIWPKVREFWLANGWLIKREDPRIGVLETDWAENRADIPDGVIRGFLKKALDTLYSAATRDKYRVRLERGTEAGTTELFLTHYGVEEVAKGEEFVWQARPNDPELEAEMLGRLMSYFGAEEEKAERMLARKSEERPKAQLTRGRDGSAVLSLDEEFARAWRRTGLALDRVGFAVEDRDRSRGIYYVSYNDPLAEEEGKQDGWLGKLKFWGDKKKPEAERYQISISSEGRYARVTVLDAEGRREFSETAQRILSLLYEQLK